MIDKLPAYPAYRDSGLPWVGTIPSHWETRRCRFLFREIDERSKTGSETHLSMSQIHGLIPSANLKRKQLTSESYAGGKLCKQGDLVLNRLKAHLGVFAHAKQAGVISPDYSIFRPVTDGPIRYYEALFKTPIYVGEFRRSTKGIVEGFWRLYSDDFYNIRALVPPCDEQDKIVAFLREQDRQIARFIRDKRRLIELLNEQKQTIIHRAVTRGLDSNVRLRPSGIDWLGDVPEHWEIKPLKRWVEINGQALAENTDWNYELSYIDIGTVQTGRLVRSPETMKFGKSPSRARRILRKGDTIVSTVRTYLRAVWYVADDVANLIASTGFAVLTPRTEVLPELLGYIVQSNNFVDRVSANSTGIAYPAISESVLGRFTIAMPPSLDEQHDLVKWIVSETAAIKQAIERTQTEMDLIREFRERLISDVVTGKVDVRGWTPAPEDLEADDEGLAVIGDDEEIPAEEEEGDAND